MASSSASRQGRKIGLPTPRAQRPLEIHHELSGGIHATKPWPRLAGNVPAQDIEHRISLDGIQAAILRCVGIVGVAAAHQPGVFFDERRRNHAATPMFLSSAGSISLELP
jgi:hypothetical protein